MSDSSIIWFDLKKSELGHLVLKPVRLLRVLILQKLLEFELRLPLISEQKEIVRLVDSKLESLNQAETLVQKPLATLNALRDSLVSAALSGRLT